MSRFTVACAGVLWAFAALVSTATATTLVEFDAAAAGAGVDPTGVSPAWTRSSSDGLGMVNNGSYLLQDDTANPGEQYREYLSPSAGAEPWFAAGHHTASSFASAH